MKANGKQRSFIVAAIDDAEARAKSGKLPAELKQKLGEADVVALRQEAAKYAR